MTINFVTRFFQWLRATRIKRYEFLLPTKFNDGTEVPAERFDETTRELSERFGGMSLDLIQIHGLWTYAGHRFRDQLVRIRIDTSDLAATSFLRHYKSQLKRRFQQIDIWITAHEIEII